MTFAEMSFFGMDAISFSGFVLLYYNVLQDCRSMRDDTLDALEQFGGVVLHMHLLAAHLSADLW